MKTTLALFFTIFSMAAFSQPKPLNSYEKIQEALDLKLISEADAIGLKTLAFMDVPHLPSAYQPDPGASEQGPEDLVLKTVIRELPAMSELIASRVYLNLIPPAYRPVPTNKVAEELFPDPMAAPTSLWHYSDHTIAGIRVWFETDDPAKEVLALKIKSLLADKIISQTEKIMGRRHPSDDMGNNSIKVRLGMEKYRPNGGDNKLDVYLVDLPAAAQARAAVLPYENNYNGIYQCLGTASYMIVDLSFATKAPEERLMTTLAHEYFHTIQFSYDRKADCITYHNSDEGTATYIKHHLFKTLNHEHEWYEFFEDGAITFFKAAYDSWYFYLHLVLNQGEQALRAMYEGEAAGTDLESLDRVLTGGWKEAWPEFSLYNWNQDPLQDGFLQWDKIPYKPRRGTALENQKKPLIKVEEVALDTDGNYTYELSMRLPPLTRDFYAFDFKDQNIRSVSIDNPILLNVRKVKGKVLIEKYGTSTVEEVTWDDSKRHVYEYCLDNPNERIKKIVFVVANYNHKFAAPTYNFEGRVKATNRGCYKYSGRARSQFYQKNGSGGDIYADFQASKVVFQESGRTGDGFFKGHFHLAAATITYNYSGTTKEGCSGAASGNLTPDTSLDKIALGLAPYNVTADGGGDNYMFSIPTVEKHISITYTCPPPLPSYVVTFPVTLSSMKVIKHGGFDHFADKSELNGFSNNWDFTPVRE